MAAASAQRATSPYIVVYKSTGSERVPASRVFTETGAREHALSFTATHDYKSALRGFAAGLTDQDVQQLRRDPEVADIVPDLKLHALGLVPRATGETLPAGLARLGAGNTTATHEASTAAVAVLDTGIDLSHPDLNVYGAINCVTAGPADDDNGHGTLVAGVIGARNNGSGILGVTPDTRLYSVKVLDSNGVGLLSDVLCGIDWVTANASSLDIRVANLSLGGSGPLGNCESEPLHLAICDSTKAGVLYTVAAGNDARDFRAFQETPAAYPEVLTVTAMSDSDGAPGGFGAAQSCATGQGEIDELFASFSNFATTPADAAHTIAGPGVCIRSTAPGGYSSDSGTSIASPHVAGVAALCLGENGVAGPCAGLAPAQIIQKLRDDAGAHATTANGFLGDPLHSFGPFYGNLVSAEQSTIPVPPRPVAAVGPPARPASRPPPKLPTAGKSSPCRVPRLHGLTRTKARRRLARAGCRYRFKGHGRVRSTTPAAGKRTGKKVLVRLGRGHRKRGHSR
jgi:subtilisin